MAQEIRRLAKDLGKSSKEVPFFDENLRVYHATATLPIETLFPDGELAFGGVALNSS